MLTNIVKNLYYRLYPKDKLAYYKLNIGYIFHTETIYIDKDFSRLIEFCKRFRDITSSKPICTIIPPTNKKLALSLVQSGFTNESFVQRVRILEEFATIGYHGHFYHNAEPTSVHAIHSFSFNAVELRKQVESDLKWFQENNINHNGIYAAGWWFMNKFLATLLIEYGFKVDYSFSFSRYYYNQFSASVLHSNNIKLGEPFYLSSKDSGKLLCIQNFIGAHTTPFPADFDRNMSELINKQPLYTTPVGVLNSHDYDLHAAYTLKCIGHLKQNARARFMSHNQIVEECNLMDLKSIPL